MSRVHSVSARALERQRQWLAPVALCAVAVAWLVLLFSSSISLDAGHRLLAMLYEIDAATARCERAVESGSPAAAAEREQALADLASVEDRFRALLAEATPVGVFRDAELESLERSYTAALAGARKSLESSVQLADARERACGLLPDIVLDVKDRAPKLSRSPDVQLHLEQVLSRLASTDVEAGGGDDSKLAAALSNLRRMRGRFAVDEAAVLERFIDHVENIANKTSALASAAKEGHTKRLEDLGAQLFRVCNAELSARGERAAAWRVAVYGLAAMLLAGGAHALYRKRRVAAALVELRAGLEARVRTRTEELERSNRELALESAERRQDSMRAEKASEAAVAASRAKSEFLANMSHEIRTPLTAIMGFSERLSDEHATPAERSEATRTIHRNGELLLQIIDDILDLSKIEAGKFEIERTPVAPEDVTVEVHRMLADKALRKGVELGAEFTGPVPRTIVSDPVRLKQVLLNVVGNAIKFTEHGSVDVRVECLATSADAAARGIPAPTVPCLLFTVADTGIGMSAVQVERLFHPFTQADRSTARTFGGTGLGLSICKHLVEMMQGSIQVESRQGLGSTFAFTVATGPLDGIENVTAHVVARTGGARSAHDADDGVSAADRERTDGDVEFAEVAAGEHAPGAVHELSGRQPRRLTARDPRALDLRILVADDSEDSQRLIAHALSTAGAAPIVVGDGETACARVLEAAREGRPFDAVLMDMQMPKMDGYGAARALREAGYTRPIVALTASAMTSDRQRAFEAGCDAFCAKPIDWGELLDLVAHASERVMPADDATSRPAPLATVEGLPGLEADDALIELVQLFVDELTNDMLSMRLALRAGDMQTIAELAHQLKGTAGSYGFPAITEQASRVEECVRRSASPDEVQNAIAVLQDLCMQVQMRDVKIGIGASEQKPAA